MQNETIADIIAEAVVIDGPTDLTILCRDGRRFEIHKSVVCPQSHVLAVMCEIGMTEQRTGVIEHNVFDSNTVDLMLQYAYAVAYVVTKRPVPLSLLERTHEEEKVEEESERTIQKEIRKDEVKSDSASGSGDENGLSKGVRSDGVDPTAADAAAHAAAHAVPVSRENTASAPRIETILDRQQPGSLSTHLSNATIPWNDSPWLRFADKLVTHARVYDLADYYEMAELRGYALDRFAALVDQRGLDLRPKDTLRSMIDVVREVSARTAPVHDLGLNEDPLRTSFLKLVAEHSTDLCTNHHFIRDLGNSGLSDIAADMLHAVAQQLLRDRRMFVARRTTLTALQSEMKDTENYCEDCSPG